MGTLMVTQLTLSLPSELRVSPSILAWEIPWTEEPSGSQSGGSQRVGHD